jgi:hypothetical protein
MERSRDWSPATLSRVVDAVTRMVALSGENVSITTADGSKIRNAPRSHHIIRIAACCAHPIDCYAPTSNTPSGFLTGIDSRVDSQRCNSTLSYTSPQLVYKQQLTPMSECDLSRLNERSFERLVRALAFAEMGPTGSVFSTGPDGGRDFTCEGAIRGFEPRGWDGYLVLQAKFKTQLDGGKSDISWLEKQISQELAKFQDNKRGLRKPEYYIIATNIHLSGADGKSAKGKTKLGGHTKVSKIFEKWKAAIGLRDFHLWPADQIIDLLARHPTIRQTYAAFVTSGDVLTAALGQIQTHKKDFGIIMQRSLRHRLDIDQYVALNESGSVDHKKIQTSKVFIDLPVTQKNSSELDYNIIRNSNSPGFVGSIIETSRDKLDPHSVRELNETKQGKKILTNRIVLLGGPGQGKSTTGLFVIQLFRASIVSDDPSHKNDPVTREIIQDIHARAVAQNLSTSLPRRFPLHISLPIYADQISRAKKKHEDTPSLLAHIAYQLGRDADGVVDREDLRLWLSAYPWLVVFDGLDEVPPSGERPAVVEAINRFLSEIAVTDADVLIIVTSRPQGYNRDLDEAWWSHWQLADLSSEHALNYARALSLAQHPKDYDRREKIILGITQAMMQPATARLLVTPLQVTIMHLIIDGGGSAPVGRWALFNEYYHVLKRREKSKGGETREVLEKNWDHLDPVHHRAGLILQTESEISGGADSQFSRSRLKDMIDEYLNSNGYDRSSRKKHSEQLARLSLNRLVLLSVRQQGETDDEGLISFDVRALQEFMAAAQLTTESDVNCDGESRLIEHKIEERLTQIAGSAHWHHVFMIAASRCFSETSLHYLRSIIVSIPRTLETSTADCLARTGARLALDMLADGIASNHPISRRKLVEHALELLELGPQNFDERLAEIWTPETATVFEEKMSARIKEGATPAALAAWKLLFKLCRISQKRFLPIVEAHWPESPEDVLSILSAIQNPRGGLRKNIDFPLKLLWKKAYYAILQLSPDAVWQSIVPVWDRKADGTFYKPVDKYQGLFWELTNNDMIPMPVVMKGIQNSQQQKWWPLRGYFCAINGEKPFLNNENLDSANSGWIAYAAIANFRENPSKETLANCLRTFKSCNIQKTLPKYKFYQWPWPIDTLVRNAETPEQLASLADRVDNGEFGNTTDWHKAELRWSKFGINTNDLFNGDAISPFKENIAELGAPLVYISILSPGNNWDEARCKDVARIINNTWDIIKNIPNKCQVSNMARSLLIGLASHRAIIPINNDVLIDLIDCSLPYDEIYIQCLKNFSDNAWDNDKFISKLDFIMSKVVINWLSPAEIRVENLIQAYNSAPIRRHLLIGIAFGLLARSDGWRELILTLVPEAFQFQKGDADSIHAAVAVMRILKLNDITDPIVYALLVDDNRMIGIQLARMLCESDLIPRAEREALVVSLLQAHVRISSLNAEWFRAILKKILDARKSGLHEQDIWIKQLKLPEDAFRVMSK